MQIAQIQPFNVAGKRKNVTRIVIHALGEFIDLEPWDLHAVDFLRSTQLNAHALIAPSGTVLRTAADMDVVYHAKGFNMDSIGIEFLVSGVHTYGSFVQAIAQEWLTSAQYDAGVQLVQDLLAKHSITHQQVKQHSTLSPGRKVDPGAGFPWYRFQRDIGCPAVAYDAILPPISSF